MTNEENKTDSPEVENPTPQAEPAQPESTPEVQPEVAPGVDIEPIDSKTMEALSIAKIRLKGFESGSLSCGEHASALSHVEAAIGWLERRAERISEQKQ